MLPADEWWGILGDYGEAVWPAQAVLFCAGLVLVIYMFWSGKPMAGLLLKLYLAFSFGWISVVFFLTIGKGLKGSAVFAGLFMVIAILFTTDVFRQRIRFRLPGSGWKRTGTLGLTFIVMCYPLFSIALERPLEETLVPGTFPCPSTALALVLLTAALPRVDRVLYILLLIWAIPFAPLIQIPRYGVYEDTIMFVVGIYALFMLIRSWKAGTHPRSSD